MIPLAVALVCVGMLTAAVYNVKIETDIVAALPDGDGVIADARHILRNHPRQDMIVIDLSVESPAPDELVKTAEFIEQSLMSSGLFKSVGSKDIEGAVAGMIFHVAENLPVLFSKQELEQRVAPLIEKQEVKKRLEAAIMRLSDISGIGQERMIAEDPLGISGFVLEKLKSLAPSKNAEIYKGRLISKDRKHLLITAEPKQSGSDSAFSSRLDALFKSISQQLLGMEITPYGGYRAALDNETFARQDTGRAVWIASIGIILLLVFAFPRPYIGLLSLLPAVFGTIASFFVFAMLHDSISALTLGFGGAVAAITVDHGIAYLLFLDRPTETSGKKAAEEVRAVGLIAALTTIGAFFLLSMSGFPIMAQVGEFAAMAVGFSFLFVHSVFPALFPKMPSAKRKNLPLQTLADSVALKNKKWKALAALVLFVVMACFAQLKFSADLASMNTTSENTKKAEVQIKETWGDVFSKVHIMFEADTVEGLQALFDSGSKVLEKKAAKGEIESFFIPSLIFPGRAQAQQNLQAWKIFWEKGRADQLERNISQVAEGIGFSGEAFAPFMEKIKPEKAVNTQDDSQEVKTDSAYTHIDKKYFPVLGISKSGGKYIQITSVTPQKNLDRGKFYKNVVSIGSVRVFDGRLFGKNLGQHLSDVFVRMIKVIGICVVLLLFIFFLDPILVAAATVPIIFALVCTIGALNLLGRTLDIPALMLAIIVFGMGIDYSLFFVRSYQCYLDEMHSSVSVIRTAMLLAGASTLAGFGSMCFADHNLLKSAGISSSLGIIFSLAGAYFILPFVMLKILEPPDLPPCGKLNFTFRHIMRVLKRCRRLPAMFRIQVWLRFSEAKQVADQIESYMGESLEVGYYDAESNKLRPPKAILVTGTGLCAPWLADAFPTAAIHVMGMMGEEIKYGRFLTRSLGVNTRSNMSNEKPGFAKFDFIVSDIPMEVFDIKLRLSDQGRALIKGISKDAAKKVTISNEDWSLIDPQCE